MCDLGGYMYLHYDRPKLADFSNDTYYGKDLITKTKECFCRMNIDNLGYIRSMTVYAKADRIHPAKLLKLNGLHEKYLNRLVDRYEEKLIDDLLA
jgi:hypothetical protein